MHFQLAKWGVNANISCLPDIFIQALQLIGMSLYFQHWSNSDRGDSWLLNKTWHRVLHVNVYNFKAHAALWPITVFPPTRSSPELCTGCGWASAVIATPHTAVAKAWASNTRGALKISILWLWNCETKWGLNLKKMFPVHVVAKFCSPPLGASIRSWPNMTTTFQRSCYTVSMTAHPLAKVISDIFFCFDQHTSSCLAASLGSKCLGLWSCTIKWSLWMRKQTCYCLIRVDIVSFEWW